MDVLTKSATRIYIIGLLVRVLLICYGQWQDANMVVKYTDIDYMVFTDAARYAAAGESPFARSTYRYTPLLAYLLIPDITLFSGFGKLLFAVTDIVIGVFIEKILRYYDIKEGSINMYVAAWIYNPIVVNVSTRGNAESLVSILVISSLYFIMKKQILLGSIIYGLSVHMKIYPVLFGFPLLFYIDSDKQQNITFRGLFTKNRIMFLFVSINVFIVLTAWMYYLYGYEFLYEAYLYHITRKDNRHNFSVYFYYLYLISMESTPTILSKLASLISFVPQVVLMAFFTLKYYRDICFCLFLQTLTFVAFNKVCTVQYFVWYFSLLPLVLPNSNIKLFWKGLLMLAFWFVTQLMWLFFAYHLEFEGKNTFFEIWLSGIMFFVSNVFVLVMFIVNQNPPTKIKKQ